MKVSRPPLAKKNGGLPVAGKGGKVAAASSSDQEMLDEIRALLANSGSRETKDIHQAQPSPYEECPEFVKELQARDKKRKLAKEKKFKPPANPEDLVNYYLSIPNAKVPYGPDEIRQRSINLPYADSMSMVNQQMWLDGFMKERVKLEKDKLQQRQQEEFSFSSSDAPEIDTSSSGASEQQQTRHHHPPKQHQQQSHKHVVTADHLRRRYPRLCSVLKLQDSDDLSRVHLRSNVWMARFMEESYDEALSFTFKPVSDARRRKRCGLDLMALDAFPLVVQRLISRVYSVMDIRRRICIEMLVSLETIILISEAAVLLSNLGNLSNTSLDRGDNMKNELMVDGGRAQIFARFLSEEYDLDYLAMYLHCRDVTQREFGIFLKDLSPQALNDVEDEMDVEEKVEYNDLEREQKVATTSSTTDAKRTQRRKITKKDLPLDGIHTAPKSKIVPLKLPSSSLAYIFDVTMPHAQLVGFDVSRLATLCLLMAPKASLQQRAYFAGKIVSFTEKLYRLALKRQELQESMSKSSSSALEKKMATDFRINKFIPISVFLVVICEEWKLVPVEVKQSFGEGGASAESLMALNVMYDGDNAKMKAFAKLIRDTEAELGNCEAIILKLDKKERRLERKWTNNQAIPEELTELQHTRVELTEFRAEKMAIESRLFGLHAKKVSVQNSIENLWVAASQGIEIEVQEDGGDEGGISKLAPSVWREEVTDLLLSAITYNEESVSAIARNQREMEKKVLARGQEEERESAAALALQLQKQNELREPTLEEQIAALQNEALELSKVGQEEALSLGLLLPPPPAFIQSFIDNKEMERLEALRKKQELVCEEIACQQMTAEDEAMHEFLKQERFLAEHALRALLLKQQEEMRQRAETIASMAKSHVENLLQKSLEDIAQAKMLQRLDEIMKEVEKQQREEAIVATIRSVAFKELDRAVNAAMAIAVARSQQIYVEEAMRLAAEELAAREQGRQAIISEMALGEIKGSLDAAITLVTAAKIEQMWCEEQHRLALAKEQEEKAALLAAIRATSHMFVEAAVDAGKAEVEAYYAQIQEEKELRQLLEEMENVDALAEQVVQHHGITVLLVDAEVEDGISTFIDMWLVEIEERRIRERKEKEAAKQAHKVFMYLVGRIGKALVAMTVSAAVVNAEQALIDPWRPIDLEPHKFLSEQTLSEVEEMRMIGNMTRMNRYKRISFNMLARGHAIRQSCIQYQKRRTFDYMRSVLENTRLRYKMACRIQRKTCTFLEKKARRIFTAHLLVCYTRADVVAMKNCRIRAAKYVRYWKYWARVEKNAANVVFALRERRFLICYYTWLNNFRLSRDRDNIRKRKMNSAAWKLQCMTRQKLARNAVKKRKANFLLVRFAKFLIAKPIAVQKRCRGRLVAEFSHHQEKQTLLNVQRYMMKKWKRIFAISSGLHKLHMVTIKKMVKRRFRKWKFMLQNQQKLERKCATKIQSTVRMWIVKRYVLHYSRWRRGLVSFQANSRRRILIPWWTIQLRRYRAARSIQKTYRGLSTRTHMTDRRIIDLHYASSTNQYERLLYYTQKFPELISELDEEGNTALHNAAKNASRRTLKLLLRCKLQPNARNLAGYTALHLIIMSTAVNRDDCCLYMLEHGFDEDMNTPDGKTCLLLAIEYGRPAIVNQLLINGLNANIPDNQGTTCVQAACALGNFPILSVLVEYGADVNAPGYGGTFPLHDCIATENIKFANLLVSQGAYVNVYEPGYRQTPLMWAARAGQASFVNLFLLQAANVQVADTQGWTAAHHGAISDNEDVYEGLRVADTDFDAVDLEGNTPLHIAAEFGCTKYARCLLMGLCNPSVQNKYGNTPTHIAARDNKVEALDMICRYDKHVGRFNYVHQTALGLAKFHCSREAQAFLEEHYRLYEKEGMRNAEGELWWDWKMDEVTEGWKVVVGFLGEREYINESTGERSLVPPSFPHAEVDKAAQHLELPIQRAVTLVGKKEENTLTRHAYKIEYAAMAKEIEADRFKENAATVISKFIRRKLAYMELSLLKKQKKKLKVLAIFIKRHLTAFMTFVRTRRNGQVAKFQAAFRGRKLRRDFYVPEQGDYGRLYALRAKQHLGRKLLRLFKVYLAKKLLMNKKIAKNPPKTDLDWQRLIIDARIVRRTVGMYEEYVYPETRSIFFYRHKLTLESTFTKPKKMQLHDDQRFYDKRQIELHGCTSAQRALVVKLQALYRGYKIRSYYVYVEIAMTISMNAEKKYMLEPDTDSNLYNYALHCHVILHDYERARFLYVEAMRRMEWRGPDVAFVLYSYAIFSFFMHDLDFSDVLALLERAREAEKTREVQLRQVSGEGESQALAKGTFRYGKIFELAKIGFFRRYANELETEAAWHNYAIVCFLVNNDFNNSFDAFLNAFKYDPKNARLKENFDTMMRHFHGPNKKHLVDVVRARMELLAARDAEVENVKRWRHENAAARLQATKKIKAWYKDRQNKRRFMRFMANIRATRQKRLEESEKAAAGTNEIRVYSRGRR